MSSNARKTYVDILKGIGAILVLIGHLVPTESALKVYIYSFHMPLFFCLSGYVFNVNSTIYPYVEKKFKTIIIPYFIFLTLSIIVNIGLNVDMSKRDILSNVFYLKGSIIWNSSLWFLPVFFFTTIIFFLLKKILNKFTDKNIAYITLIIFVCVLGRIFSMNGVVLPFGLHIVPISLVFFCSGYLFNRNNLGSIVKNKKINIVIFLLCVIISYTTSIANGRANMSTNAYGNYILFYISAFAGTLVFYYISKLIKANKILELFGKFSLIMFCTQRPLFKIFPSAILRDNIILYISTCLCIYLLIFYTYVRLKKYRHKRKIRGYLGEAKV